MRSAGANYRKVIFKRKTTVESSRGSMTDGAAQTVATTSAEVNYGSGSERRRAGIEASEVAATVRVISSVKTRLVDASCIAELDGQTWNVTGSVPWKRSELDITLIRKG